jgi:EAL domain-containing protein (putative c-di-GMP-specific phosphodiesterase class I)/DNA-binding response OmpR family regulator
MAIIYREGESDLHMNNNMNNVLILDPGSHKKNILQDILSKAGFNIHLSSGMDDAMAALATFKPDIILCRASSRVLKDSIQLCGFHDAAEEKNIPFVVVSAVSDVESFLKVLGRGVTHSIMPPFSMEFLVKRINEILNWEKPADEGGPVDINFRYRGAMHSLHLRPSQLAQFVISMLSNSINHSLTLNAVMQKKNLLQQRMCRPELFEGIKTKTEAELHMEMELNRGLERGEFDLYYQPIMSIAEERITGFEALIRWNHPENGFISPDDFIPFAERLPFIMSLGYWVIEKAVKQIGKWHDAFAISHPVHVGVNLSANQFVNPGLSDGIAEIIRNNNADPSLIAFEITESAFMSDMETANVQLLKLKSSQHSILMDDFGTGYSSLSYLQHFPVDILKIDQSFVRWMHIDEQSLSIVRSVVGLAHNLGMKVVAEGLEEKEHLTKLRELECDFGQGYLFSVPLDAESAGNYLGQFFRKKKNRSARI